MVVVEHIAQSTFLTADGSKTASTLQHRFKKEGHPGSIRGEDDVLSGYKVREVGVSNGSI